MMFPRSVTVRHAGAAAPETRFWFPVDHALLAAARRAAPGVVLDRCTAQDTCLQQDPRVVVGGPGVSGGAFVDNAAFREYAFATFGARVLDMESAAVAHVAFANRVPFLAIRSLSDLAGGGTARSRRTRWSVRQRPFSASPRSTPPRSSRPCAPAAADSATA